MSSDPIGRPARVAHGETLRGCTATNRKGDPCGLPPIKGGFVCHFHGGAAPQTRAAAKQRLWELLGPAFAALGRALLSAEPCEVCGRSDADKDPAVIRAAQIVLDRTGFHPAVAVQVSRGTDDPKWTAWLTDAQLTQVGEWIDDAKERMAAGAPRPGELMPADTLLLDDGDADTTSDEAS